MEKEKQIVICTRMYECGWCSSRFVIFKDNEINEEEANVQFKCFKKIYLVCRLCYDGQKNDDVIKWNDVD